MKKMISLVLAAMLVLSLAACGDKNNASDGDKPAKPTSALNILETVWNTYGSAGIIGLLQAPATTSWRKRSGVRYSQL